MQDLDNFILPISGFEGDIPIPAILISACDPGAESSHDPSTGSGAGTARTRAGKQKAPIDPSFQKKDKKSSQEASGQNQDFQSKTQGSCFDSSIGDSEGHPDQKV
jgi:hypothetical protein